MLRSKRCTTLLLWPSCHRLCRFSFAAFFYYQPSFLYHNRKPPKLEYHQIRIPPPRIPPHVCLTSIPTQPVTSESGRLDCRIRGWEVCGTGLKGVEGEVAFERSSTLLFDAGLPFLPPSSICGTVIHSSHLTLSLIPSSFTPPRIAVGRSWHSLSPLEESLRGEWTALSTLCPRQRRRAEGASVWRGGS